MKFPAHLLAALAAFPGAGLAQISDPFDSINPAWVTNRYEPAGFESVVFDGDSRLRLTIDQTGSTANRGVTFSSPFYNTQGRQRAGGITGLWTLSAQVYVSSAFNTTTGPLVESDLWGHTGTTPDGGDYLILGFTNASPTDVLNPAAADRSFRFQAYDGETDSWFNLGVPAGFVFDAWHTLSGTSNGTTFEFRIDGVLVLTSPTVAGDDLLSAMIQGYNFDAAGSYSVYWDNLTAVANLVPSITNYPLTAAGTIGSPFNFVITASGLPTNYAATPLPSGLSLVAATGAITGVPTTAGTTSVLLSATNASGTGFATLTITITATRLVNLSVRTTAGSGSQTLIAGFVVSGGSKAILARGIGPALSAYGVTGVLPDPELELFAGANTASPFATNTAWGGTAALTNAFNATGAFTLPNLNSKDTALLITLPPGVYTAEITGAGGDAGIALAEIYDADGSAASGTLTNVSARAQVGVGNAVLIAGFVISGTANQTVLIRGIGPALATYGATGVLPDPLLSLYSAANTSAPIATNTAWGGATALVNAFAATGAFTLPNPNSKDTALLVSLPPGIYSAQVSGASGDTGVALIEVYVVQ